MTTHRSLLVVATAVVALAGCGSGATFAAAGCDPLQHPQLQEGSHLIGDATPPVPYSSSPPTSGWHSSGRPVEAGAYTDPVPEPQQVRFLEFGGVVVAYDPALPAEQVGALQRIAGEVDGVLVTPYAGEMDAPVALTAWGVLAPCREVAAQDVAAFRDAHAGGPGH